MAAILLPDGVVQLGTSKVLIPGGVVQVTETVVIVPPVVVAVDTKANAGGGKKQKKLPYYETKDYVSNLVVERKVEKPVQEKPVVHETRTEAKAEQAVPLNELIAQVSLPQSDRVVEVVVNDESDIETAVVMLLLAA